MRPSPPPEREVARLILEREMDEQRVQGGSPAKPVPAADRVLRRLHEHLVRWFGRDGSHAVLARGLDRARAGHRVLADARLEPGGERVLAGLAERVRDDEATEAVVALITSVIALLTRLIGADMVARLLHQAWPGATTEEAPKDMPATMQPPARIPTSKIPDEDAPNE